MPRLVAPWKSGPHRNAAIALFRRLISRARTALPDLEARTSFRNVVRHKFHWHRHSQSSHVLGQAFKEGYEIADLLNVAAAGNEAASHRIHELLSGARPRFKLAPPQPSEPQKPHYANPPASPPDPSYSILARPRTQVAGIRRVPVLVNASGYPMLRIKKPQPAFLSKYLTRRLRAHQRRIDAVHSLENYWIPLAGEEDLWDSILRRETTREQGRTEPYLSDDVSWVYEVIAAKGYVERQIAEEYRKRTEMTFKMQEIVRKETELAEKEAHERRLQRRATKESLELAERSDAGNSAAS